MSFLGSISKEEFLKDYWEKKPLLIKNAVSDVNSFATIGDIKELAYDSDFESRIVYNDKGVYSLKHGPLTQDDFNDKKWTLACHNLNLLSENFYQLQKQLDFLPDWLFDDVMATYSNKDATIGAHIDKYNVFILQGMGQRKWQLETNPDPQYQEGLELKILKNFSPEIEWTIEPGDMIYIPSNVAHQGISMTESISYSIGLKSLEDEIIIKNYLEQFISQFESDDYLKDSTSMPVKDPYIHNEKISNHFYKKLLNIVANEKQFKLWFNNFLSTPKEPIEKGEVYIEEQIREFSKENFIRKDIYTKLAASKNENDYVVSINSTTYSLSERTYIKIKQWFSASPFDPIKIDLDQLDNEQWSLLLDLFKNGTLYFESN